jgi:chromosome segregation ATPase
VDAAVDTNLGPERQGGIDMTAPLRTRICDLFKRAIEQLAKDIEHDEERLASLVAILSRLEAQRPPDTERIAATKREIAVVTSALEEHRAQKNGFEEEFSAECRP